MESIAATSLASLWGELVGTQPDPDTWVVIATAAAALAAIVPHGVWRLSRNAITIAHEGGHGLIALLTGRTLTGIRLHSDTSGLTVSRGKPTGLGMILTAAAGYPAPPLLGLGGAALLGAGHLTLLLWLATILLVAMLIMIRNAYGALTVLLTGGTFVTVSWLATPRSRRPSRTRSSGSSSWAEYARPSNSRPSAEGAARETRTQTSSAV